jgi:hypothetical protein
LLLSLAILKYRQYFFLLQTLKLTTKIGKVRKTKFGSIDSSPFDILIFSSKLKQRVSENIDEIWEELESFGITGSSTGNLEDFEDEVKYLLISISLLLRNWCSVDRTLRLEGTEEEGLG